MTPILEINQLCKTYRSGSVVALDGLDLTVNKGDIFGLLGPNGAGKTTTLAIVTGRLRHNGGQIRLAGCDLPGGLKKIKHKTGVVPQETALYPSLTGRENLRFFGRIYHLSSRRLDERVAHYLEIMGLTRAADRRVDTYSGGMARRLNLLCGIIHQPEILFLDEPTVGVDVQSRAVILNYIQRLRDEGTTVIYTSHYLEEAESLCNRVAIIDRGVKLIEGSPEQLIQDEQQVNNLEELFLHLTGRELRD